MFGQDKWIIGVVFPASRTASSLLSARLMESSTRTPRRSRTWGDSCGDRPVPHPLVDTQEPPAPGDGEQPQRSTTSFRHFPSSRTRSGHSRLSTIWRSPCDRSSVRFLRPRATGSFDNRWSKVGPSSDRVRTRELPAPVDDITENRAEMAPRASAEAVDRCVAVVHAPVSDLAFVQRGSWRVRRAAHRR